MTNYTKTTDFAAKDSLPSGDSGKIIRGSEFETEFDNIATAIATKADAASPTFTGTVTIDGLTVNGNTILGNAATDTVTVTADIASNLIPSADDTYNLGASGAEWNDLFIDGTANIDTLVADTADINGGTIDGVTIGGSSAGAITGTAISGTSFASTGNMTFGDNNKAIFGASSDLQIYHDGTDTQIREVGTGNLKLITDGAAIQLQSTTENMVVASPNAGVQLFYDNSEKLVTTTTGVDVTGTVTADGLTVDGESDLNATVTITHANPRIKFIENDSTNSNTQFSNDAGDFAISTMNDAETSFTKRFNLDHATGDISFYEDTGTTAKFFWDASAENLQLSLNGEALKLGSSSGTDDAYVSFQGSRALVGIDDSLGTITGTASSAFIKSGGGRGIAFNVNNASSSAMVLNSSGNVGIGTSSPTADLDVDGRVQIGKSLPNPIDTVTDLSLYGNSIISSESSLSFGVESGGFYRFFTGVTSNTGGIAGGTEAMRIDSSSNVLVGKTSVGLSTVGVEARSTGVLGATADGVQAAYFTRKTSDGAIVEFRKDSTSVGSIGVNSSNAYFTSSEFGIKPTSVGLVSTNTSGVAQDGAEDLGGSSFRWRDLYLSGGAYLGGTAAANKLDDYEEGTWTPVYEPETGSFTTLTMDTPTAEYTKVGQLVVCRAIVRTDNVDTTGASGALRIAGLPFVPDNFGGTASISLATGFASNTPIGGYVDNNSSYVNLLYRTAIGGATSTVQVSDMTTGASADKNYLILTITYFTNE